MEKQVLEVKPLEGLGPVRFGMKAEAVHAVLGQPEDTFLEEDDNVEVFAGKQVYVFYDGDLSVEYIEVKAFRSESLDVLLFGYPVFAHDGDELVQVIEATANAVYDPDSPELPYSYFFPDLNLNLYRPVIPADYEVHEDDDEHGKGVFFQHLGFGRQLIEE